MVLIYWFILYFRICSIGLLVDPGVYWGRRKRSFSSWVSASASVAVKSPAQAAQSLICEDCPLQCYLWSREVDDFDDGILCDFGTHYVISSSKVSASATFSWCTCSAGVPARIACVLGGSIMNGIMASLKKNNVPLDKKVRIAGCRCRRGWQYLRRQHPAPQPSEIEMSALWTTTGTRRICACSTSQESVRKKTSRHWWRSLPSIKWRLPSLSWSRLELETIWLLQSGKCESQSNATYRGCPERKLTVIASATSMWSICWDVKKCNWIATKTADISENGGPKSVQRLIKWKSAAKSQNSDSKTSAHGTRSTWSIKNCATCTDARSRSFRSLWISIDRERIFR